MSKRLRCVCFGVIFDEIGTKQSHARLMTHRQILRQASLGILASLITLSGWSQTTRNPSLEGEPKAGRPPNGWYECTTLSSPDTQPGITGVTLPASEGATYVSLVTRGDLGPLRNTTEDIGSKLDTVLHPAKAYILELDLATSPTFGHTLSGGEFLPYQTPVQLQVFMGDRYCDLSHSLWMSQPITHHDWKTYAITLPPLDFDAGYLIVRAEYTQDSTYFGNVLMDHVRFTECPEWTERPELRFDTAFCRGNPVTLYPPAQPCGAGYLWSDGSRADSLVVAEGGTYTVDITSECGRQRVVFEVEEEWTQLPAVQYGTVFCQGGVVTLRPPEQESGMSYQWSDGTQADSLVVSSSGTYSVEVTSACEGQQIVFEVQMEACLCEISYPTAFSPNGDGINEGFVLTLGSGVIGGTLKVFNRQGLAVYQSDDLARPWEGIYRSKPLPAGVYYWWVNYHCVLDSPEDSHQEKGWVQLVR